MTAISTTVTVTATQVRDLHLRGFLCLDAFLSPREVAILKRVYDERFLSRQVDRDTTFAQLQAELPELRRLDVHDRALRLAQQLIGDQATLAKEKFMYRRPDDPYGTPWHQDWAFGHPEYLKLSVNLWIPLQDVDMDNGCLWYLPGSHLQDILPHRHLSDRQEGHQKDVILEADTTLIDESRAVPAILPAGGVAIHLANTLHSAHPNRSADARRAYIMHYDGLTYERLMKRGYDSWPWMAFRDQARVQEATA
ncbi:MAG: phytanoyl-CoA dioxygenase family protein [Planctomycetota bacterium]